MTVVAVLRVNVTGTVWATRGEAKSAKPRVKPNRKAPNGARLEVVIGMKNLLEHVFDQATSQSYEVYHFRKDFTVKTGLGHETGKDKVKA